MTGPEECAGDIHLACDEGALATNEAGEETRAKWESGLSVKYKRALHLFQDPAAVG